MMKLFIAGIISNDKLLIESTINHSKFKPVIEKTERLCVVTSITYVVGEISCNLKDSIPIIIKYSNNIIFSYIVESLPILYHDFFCFNSLLMSIDSKNVDMFSNIIQRIDLKNNCHILINRTIKSKNSKALKHTLEIIKNATYQTVEAVHVNFDYCLNNNMFDFVDIFLESGIKIFRYDQKLYECLKNGNVNMAIHLLSKPNYSFTYIQELLMIGNEEFNEALLNRLL
jgi:hypothetical protein